MQRDDEERESLSHLIRQNKDPNRRKTGVNVTHEEGEDGTIADDIDQDRKKKYLKWGLIGGLILIIVTLSIVLPLTLIGGDEEKPKPKPPVMPNSTNEYYINPASAHFNTYSFTGQLLIKKPAKAHLLGDDQSGNFIPKIGVDWNQTIKFSKNNMKSEVLNYTFDMVNSKLARLTLTDGVNPRFSIPSEVLSKPESDKNSRLDMVGFKFDDKDTKYPFSFSFRDINDPTNVYVDTQGQNLIFSDKYIQMDFILPSQRQYGFGERIHGFRLNEGAWGMWANSQNGLQEADDGYGRGGEYGVHPFLLVQTKKPQEYFGLFFRNANAQLPIIRFSDDNKTNSTTLSYITLGGQIEIYFFIHGSAKQVIQDYHRLIGKPQLPPFWSLGWQEATAKGDSQVAIEEQIKLYKDAILPLESVYLGINSSNKTKNFNLNTTLITNVTELKQTLQQRGQRLVAYLDSAIYAPEHTQFNNTEDFFYWEGDAYNVFIKTTWNQSPNHTYNNNLLGIREQQKCVYIDWFNFDHTPTYWLTSVGQYKINVPFDGLWTTENEPFSQIQGELQFTKPQVRLQAEEQQQDYFDKKWFTTMDSGEISTYAIPFTPQYKEQGPFDNFSISLNATHNNFTVRMPNGEIKVINESEYNLHSLYGHAMMQNTHRALSIIPSTSDQRPFILTRSTFASSGRYASYSIRSKYRTWDALKYTIPHMMNLNMFGIPHSGADICGFYESDNKADKFDEELCLRWIQLATFFPLARHSQAFTNEQAYLTGALGMKDTNNQRSAQASMHDRLQYLRLMYTCLFEASEFGGSCFDPIYFHHTLDLTGYVDEAGTNDTFIFANTIKVSPIVQSLGQNKTYKSHFPSGKWLNLANFEVLNVETAGLQTLNVLSTVNAHLTPGSLIPYQNNKDMTAMTTHDLLRRPTSLIINRNTINVSTGTVFLDGGYSKSELTNKTYEYYTITHKASKSIQFQLTKGARGSQDDKHTLDQIIIGAAPDLHNTDFACAFMQDGSIIELNSTFETSTNVLRMHANRFSQDLKFSKLSHILYGSSANKDLNLCRESAFQYMIPTDFNVTVALNSSESIIPLVHKQGTLPNLNLTLRIFDDGILNVKWSWQEKFPQDKRVHYPVPDDIVDTSRPSKKGDVLSRYLIIQSDPFVLNFTAQKGQSDVFLSLKNLVYDSYYNYVGLQAISTLKGDKFHGVMGLGERTQNNLFYKDGTYSLWSTNQLGQVDDGKPPGNQGYGTHPFFMYQHNENNWVGIFFKQAQAQDWTIKNYPYQGLVSLKQVATGGLTDIYVMFKAQKPDTVIGSYQNIIGKPVLLPQWALGWHTSKWCYRNTDEYRQVVDNYRNFNLPLDAQWGDSDYMDRYRTFTLDPINFGNMTAYVDDLFHNKSTKFVPILAPGIAVANDYDAYTKGKQEDIFLKLKGHNDPYRGRVWPGESVFPDFFHPNIIQWYHDQLTNFQEKMIWFDGIQLDMTEPANFCEKDCNDRQRVLNPVADHFIQTPTGRELTYKSLPLDIKHYNEYLQLDAHQIYGTQLSKLTSDWFNKKQAKRPFIVGRNTFSGFGKFGGKQLGDSSSTYEDMQRSVTGTMMMNVFGVPFAGGNICGFSGPNSSPELCARWHQVGAFQPLSRNHRDCDGSPQEPYRFKDVMVNDRMSITDIMRDAIQTKYSLIRYYYTQMFLLSKDTLTVGAFYKPLFFEWPNDQKAYDWSNSENVMLGPSLKLSIKTSPNTNWTTDMNSYYFPQGTWCDIRHPELGCLIDDKNGTVHELPAGIDDYQVHLREGHAIPMQNANVITPRTTDDLRLYPVDFHFNPRNTTTNPRSIIFSSSGVYVNDDGLTPLVNSTSFNQYQMSMNYRNSSGGETLSLTFALKNNASAYYSNETKCSFINQNDFLGSIYIYDYKGFLQDFEYYVELIRPDQTFEDLGTAKFEETTNRLVYNYSDAVKYNPASAKVCLSFIQELRFRPKNNKQ